MPRINLLPWRDEQRHQRRTQFFVAMGIALAVGGLIVLLGNLTMNSFVDQQNARNTLLKTEISALNKRIEEILELEDKKDRLLARMEIIEELQRSRPEIVHVFEELVTTLPDGTHLTAIKQSGRRIEIRGTAESNTRVSALMRNINSSDWLTDPDLDVVQVREGRNSDGTRASEFTVFAKQVSIEAAEEAE